MTPEHYPLATSAAFWLEHGRYMRLPYVKGWWQFDNGEIRGFVADRKYETIAVLRDGRLHRCDRRSLAGICMLRSDTEEWFWTPGHLEKALPALLRRTAACPATAWVLADEFEAMIDGELDALK